MAKIRVLRENNLGNTSSNCKIYPVTVSDAVYIDKKRLTEVIDELSKLDSLKYYKEGEDTIELSASNVYIKINGEYHSLQSLFENSETWIQFLLISNNNLFQGLNDLQTKFNNLEKRVSALEEVPDSEDDHWHSPTKPPIPVPSDLDVEVVEGLLELLGNKLEYSNNLLTIPYSTVNVEEDLIIFN